MNGEMGERFCVWQSREGKWQNAVLHRVPFVLTSSKSDPGMTQTKS